MALRKIRPRFKFAVPLSPDEVVAKLDERLQRPDSPCGGRVADRHHTVDLRICDRQQHFWSPTLNITVAENESGEGSVVHGLVGPNANVWTLFAMLYLGVATFLVGTVILGLVQRWLDLPPWGLYLAPILVLALVLMYVVSRLGQTLATPQTILLREFLDDTLGVSEASHRTPHRDPYRD